LEITQPLHWPMSLATNASRPGPLTKTPLMIAACARGP
jgi:hypothetical protein